ncbi:DNA-binding protein [bacterium]|nr:DNA-binding protein [bacterium]
MGRNRNTTLQKPQTKVKVSGVRRSATISCKYLTKEELALKKRLDTEEWNIERPEIREHCENGIRPCPFVGCKYHLYLDVNKENGSIKFNFPDLEFDELEETCSLDIIKKGDTTLDAIGKHMNLTRERVRQIEAVAIEKLTNSGLFPKEVLEFFQINQDEEDK